MTTKLKAIESALLSPCEGKKLCNRYSDIITANCYFYNNMWARDELSSLISLVTPDSRLRWDDT